MSKLIQLAMSVKIELDDLDIAILQKLQEDGRRPYADIGKCLGISSGTVRNRVCRFTESGILKVVGWISPLAVGFKAPAQIQVIVEPPELLDEVADKIAEIPEAVFVAIVTGEFDILLDVRCRDLEHLLELISKRLQKIHGVAKTHTNMFLRVVKYQPPDIHLIRGE